MEYENLMDYSEFNPEAIKIENELKMLAQIIETPAESFFQKIIRKILISHAKEARL